jgi:hypothetical protein
MNENSAEPCRFRTGSFVVPQVAKEVTSSKWTDETGQPGQPGKRIALDGPGCMVIDGPFAEVRELVLLSNELLCGSSSRVQATQDGNVNCGRSAFYSAGIFSNFGSVSSRWSHALPRRP